MKRLAVFLAILTSMYLCLAASFAQSNNASFSQQPAEDAFKLIDQGEHDPRLKGYKTPDGVKVEIVAEYPTVVNPVGMTFGPDGTLFVLEWAPPKDGKVLQTHVEIIYKDGMKCKIPVLEKANKDVMKILLDEKDDDGVYDKSKLVLEEDMPSGILIHDGFLYLSGQGTVRRYKMQGAHGPFGAKEIVARGFGGFFHRQVSGLTIGNDGWLYISVGAGDHYVEGSDGSRADVRKSGAIFRCTPDGQKMHVFASGFHNPYRDVAFDAAYNMFHLDNDHQQNAKYAGCRLLHVVEEADYGWRSLSGAVDCKPDPQRAALFGELPGKMAPILKTGRGAPSGLFIYNDSCFPESFRGLLYYPDVLRQEIRAHQVERDGATFKVVHEFPFLKSNDPLFRPCQMVLGPDGAMYVCDWRTNSIGKETMWGDGKHGRIYRLSWAGTKDESAIPLRGMDSWAKIAKQSDDELFKTLASGNFSDRLKAQQELAQRGENNRKKLVEVLVDEEQPLAARIAASGSLQSMWNEDVEAAFLKLIFSDNSDLKRLAIEGLALNSAQGDKEVLGALILALSERDYAVRRSLVLAIGKNAAPGAADSLVNMLKFDESKDAYLRDGIIRAIERLDEPGIEALIALTNSGVKKDLDLVVATYPALRSKAAANALPELLRNVHLTFQQKVLLREWFDSYSSGLPMELRGNEK